MCPTIGKSKGDVLNFTDCKTFQQLMSFSESKIRYSGVYPFHEVEIWEDDVFILTKWKIFQNNSQWFIESFLNSWSGKYTSNMIFPHKIDAAVVFSFPRNGNVLESGKCVRFYGYF